LYGFRWIEFSQQNKSIKLVIHYEIQVSGFLLATFVIWHRRHQMTTKSTYLDEISRFCMVFEGLNVFETNQSNALLFVLLGTASSKPRQNQLILMR
jgi:hypothetical protein